MSRTPIIEKLEKKHLKKERGNFRVGDTVKVHTRIIEGSKERIQIFAGTVIARRGTGLSETFSVHRIAYSVGMERVFLLHSPRIAQIEVVVEGDVRRGKLYHLRGTQGKAAKVKRRIGPSRQGKKTPAAVEEEIVDEVAVEETPVEETPINDEAQSQAEEKAKVEGAAEQTPATATE